MRSSTLMSCTALPPASCWPSGLSRRLGHSRLPCPRQRSPSVHVPITRARRRTTQAPHRRPKRTIMSMATTAAAETDMGRSEESHPQARQLITITEFFPTVPPTLPVPTMPALPWPPRSTFPESLFRLPSRTGSTISTGRCLPFSCRGVPRRLNLHLPGQSDVSG